MLQLHTWMNACLSEFSHGMLHVCSLVLFVCVWFKPNTEHTPHSNHHHHSSMGQWLLFVGQGVGRRKMVSFLSLTTAMFSHWFFLPFLQEKSSCPHQPMSPLWCSTWDCVSTMGRGWKHPLAIHTSISQCWLSLSTGGGGFWGGLITAKFISVLSELNSWCPMLIHLVAQPSQPQVMYSIQGVVSGCVQDQEHAGHLGACGAPMDLQRVTQGECVLAEWLSRDVIMYRLEQTPPQLLADLSKV